jgi:two-component system C4-dicarboxylate transport response regulator DctD
MQMPRGDGLELITALKGIDPGASIVAVSGQAPARLQVAHQSGARSILTKPIDRHELIEAVERALRPPENDPLTI